MTKKPHKFKIGNVEIENPLVLAPMAGVTDTVFRQLIKNMGAGLLYTEMISSQALHYCNAKTLKLTGFTPGELPLSAQIFGQNPELMAEAAKKLEDAGFSIIDINMGCSVPKVAKAGAGASLCRDLPLAAKIMDSVVKAVNIPVTVKIRIGWSRQEITAFEVCRIAEECGISAVAVHGRTSAQKYSGKADWDFISQVKTKTKLPVIGNGDIHTAEQAETALYTSGCDGIMIGRESLNNPWVFRDAAHRLRGLPAPPPPTWENIRNLILVQLEGTASIWGKNPASDKMRKFIAWYSRGLPGSARFRESIFKSEGYETAVAAVNSFFDGLKQHREKN